MCIVFQHCSRCFSTRLVQCFTSFCMSSEKNIFGCTASHVYIASASLWSLQNYGLLKHFWEVQTNYSVTKQGQKCVVDVLGPQSAAAGVCEQCGLWYGDGHAMQRHNNLWQSFSTLILNCQLQLVVHDFTVMCSLSSCLIPDDAQRLFLGNPRKVCVSLFLLLAEVWTFFFFLGT